MLRNLALALTLLITTTAYADKFGDAIKDLGDYREYANDRLLDEGSFFFLFVDKLTKQTFSDLATAECEDENNFKPSNRKEVIVNLTQLLLETDHKLNTHEPAYLKTTALLNLYDTLYGKKIETCSERTTPPYSDGQKLTFVKVNGKHKFYYGFGFPD